MTLRIAALVWLLSLALAPLARAQTVATIAYDVKLREFTCWTERALGSPLIANPAVRPAAGAPPVCNSAAGWHPVTSDLYFTRGQAISLLLVNAVAMDLFSLEVSEAELKEPEPDIAGSFGDLPSLVPLIPAPTFVAPSNVSFAGAPGSVLPSDLYRRLTASEEKDFTAWLKSDLIAPLKSDSVNAFLALDTETTLGEWSSASVMPWITAVDALIVNVNGLTMPVTTEQLIDRARALVRLLEAQTALRNRLLARGAPVAGKVLADGLKALNVAALVPALAIDAGDFGVLMSSLEGAFPADTRYASIATIVAVNGVLRIQPQGQAPRDPTGAMKSVLDRVQSAAGGNVDAPELARLKKNLEVMFDLWNDMRFAKGQSEALAAASSNLKAYRDGADGLFALQAKLNALADASIAKATALNASAATIPLDENLRVLPVGQWFGTKTVTLTVKKGQRAALNVAGVSSVAGGAVTVPAPSGEPKAVQPAIADLASARVIKFPVYNTYRFQLGLGAAYSSADDVSYKVTTVTTGSGQTATTEKFVEKVDDRGYNLLWTANVIVFPWARHAFPWRPRYAGEKGPNFLNNFGGLVGFSIPDPTRNFFFGGAWFSRQTALGVQVSWHIALRDVYTGDPDKPVTELALYERQRFHGYSFGLVATPEFFTKVLSPIFGL